MNFLQVLILKLEYKGSDQGMLSVSLCRASASFELEISSNILASNKLRNFHVINFVLLFRRSMMYLVFIVETMPARGYVDGVDIKILQSSCCEWDIFTAQYFFILRVINR